MAELVRPAALSAGDIVRVVSPSWGGPALFPDRFAAGLEALGTALGVTVEVGEHARVQTGDSAGTRKQRAADFNAALADPRVRMIVWSIGGHVSAELLDLIDYAAFVADPKIICGYSDATVLHQALYAACGAVTLYGPAVIPQWGEHPGPDPWTVALSGAPSLRNRPSSSRARQRWSRSTSTGSPPRPSVAGAARPVPGRPCVEAPGHGPLLVGCLPSALQLLGTPWQPDYRGHLIVLELPDDEYDLSLAGKDLWQLRNAGLLDEIAGLVVGRPRLFTGEQRDRLDQILTEVTEGHDYPVVTEVEVGHTDSVLTLPNGIAAELAGTDLTILESATR